MNKLFFGVVFALASITLSHAQTVGTIGVGDISLSLNAYDVELGSQKDVLKKVNEKFNAAITNTRKFRALDHSQLNDFLTQRSLELKSYYEPIINNAQVDYQHAGLDYILSAQVNEFSIDTKRDGGESVSIGTIRIAFDLLGVADLTSKIKTEVTAKINVRSDRNELFDKQSVINQTIESGANLVLNRVLSRLYPVRVMKAEEDNSIKLNYGEGFLHPGDVVFLYDGKADDIFNKEGKVPGKAIATLKVLEVYKRFSSAQVLNGLENIKPRSIGQVIPNNF